MIFGVLVAILISGFAGANISCGIDQQKTQDNVCYTQEQLNNN